MEKRRFVVLDGMRGLAALSVVALHTAQYFPSQTGPARAYLAVDFFFMLSGFVMAHAYGDKLRAGLTIKGFAEIRLARLYPMIFLGVTLGLLARVCAPDGSGAGLLATLGAAIFAYLILPTPRLSSSTPEHPLGAFPINGPLWSLTFELLSNLIYAMFVRWLTGITLAICCAILCAALICLSLVNDGIGNLGLLWGWTLGLATVRVMAPFLIGIVLYSALRSTSWAIPSWAAICPAAVLLAFLWYPAESGKYYDVISVLIIFPSIIFISAICRDGGKLQYTWNWIGALSYPIYAINVPILRILHNILPTPALIHGSINTGSVAFALCIMAGQMALSTYDIPIRTRLGHLLGRRRPPGGGDLRPPL